MIPLLAAVVTLTTAAAISVRHDPSPPATWTETSWSLPLDNWGQGRVWHGPKATLYARTKTGFCNCFNGIADDNEIDLIGDVDLHGDQFTPIAPGETISLTGSLTGMSGRKRAFQATAKWHGVKHVLSIVTAEDCKAVVVTIVSPQSITADIEAAAAALLTTGGFRQWAADQ